ncbi:ricin-type beta-trefoil lectin domain protein [Lentzea flaviverrucosa]|uniref:Poly(3-hydroxybutyrate) depolymerase n=1 Tax=Lentzea flaviverrucosa TaxID=200379 RepID=A0A1H9IYL9_9PSEU|nr:ricin-type beta-trefoil lectin domain protein [Lentzea flaviverrucosa]RDI16803.1 poly(3-hydroxybutyrate) depolymerase [Lentzea flaviverrucosa]SEQ79597.1 Poly(3-hydroxybutyrate) depolymerase [Lentzea flaviverrucosa]
MHQHKKWWLTTVAIAALVLSGVSTGTAAADPQTPLAAGSQAPLAATPGCGKAPTLRSGTQTIQSGGKNRSFVLSVPDNYDNTRQYRLVFGFHWWGGTMNDVASGGSDGDVYAHYGLRRLANNSAIFVAPQGIGNGWANSGGEDVTFVDDMLRRIENDLCVDTTQRFSLGFSYGGAMSISLACSRPNVFRAIAAIASPGEISGCAGGTAPVAFMGIHGIGDNIGSGRGQRDRWVRNNGCQSQNAPEPAAGSRTHITTTYSGCRAGYPVVWAPFDGGHQQGPVDGCAGCESGARSWVKTEVWKFFTGDTTPAPTTFRLRGEASGRCLDVSGAGTANGSPMVVWDCHSNANQQFTRTGQTLQVLGKCLDAPANATAGTAVRLWDCQGGANQQWNVNSNGTIGNAQTGLCLDVNGAGTANGTTAIVWTCHGGANQRWAQV